MSDSKRAFSGKAGVFFLAVMASVVGGDLLDRYLFEDEQREFCSKLGDHVKKNTDVTTLKTEGLVGDFTTVVTYKPTYSEMPRIPLVGKSDCRIVLEPD